jgi:hypothetical protein
MVLTCFSFGDISYFFLKELRLILTRECFFLAHMRCNEIAAKVIFQTFFRRFLAIIQVARLAMVYMSKFSAGSIDFFRKSIVFELSSLFDRRKPLKVTYFYSSCLVLGWRSIYPNYHESDCKLARILLFTF